MSNLSYDAERIMRELIVRDGLSYADAIAECERRAARLARPYKVVAARLRAELAKDEHGAPREKEGGA